MREPRSLGFWLVIHGLVLLVAITGVIYLFNLG